MPKLKTNRGAAKRFRKTASGGFKTAHSHLRHILTKKATNGGRHLGSAMMVHESDVRAVRRMLPHS